MRRRVFLSALVLLSGIVVAAHAEPAASRPASASGPIRSLMLVGGSAHDYDALPRQLADRLAPDGIAIRVTQDPADFTGQALADTDVMIFNCCYQTGPAEAARKAILDALAARKGLVLMHCAVWSFQDWPAWREIVGGVFDKHDPFGAFESVVVDRGHPIARGVPDRFTIQDEAYVLKDFTGDRHTLVMSVKPHGGHAEPEPFAWTSRHLGARVFTTLYGHDARSQQDPACMALLANGIRWAAGRLGPATMLGDLERKDGFVPLFDGKSLTGWKYDPRLWQVRDGIIIGRTPADWKSKSYAICPKELTDFVLRYSIRVVRGNSGVQFRSRELPDYEVAGYQADAAVKAWGNLHEQNGRRRLVDGWWHNGEYNADLTGWNEQEIVARGDRIILKLNGVVAADYTEKDASVPRAGIIALQLHDDSDMEVHFTNIRIKPLGKD
ncbi:MAG TPA: ThuA domain-containing protein [Phycisphaerae bacterium]|nr:ThuA domain-containing protein [Phycisphaerae bacterium]